jgi:hypothetical protein
MTYITKHEGEVTMYKRTLKALFVVAALGIAFPVQAALGMPTSDTGGKVVVQKSAPIVSEKLAGLNLQLQAKQYAPIVSEKTAGLNLSTPQTATPVVSNAPIVSEKTAGLNLPTVQQPVDRVYVSSTPTFDWGDAGIGAGVVFGSLLAAIAAAGMLRRHQGHFAH